MATFDQLSAEQRAIVELVVEQAKSYEELADMLGMPETRVRKLARDALVDLAPVSARHVEEDWRGQLADYVLGQQSGPEATATKGHLRRSEAARTWTRSLLDSLEQLYQNGSLPAIPEGERARRERGPRRLAAAGGGAAGAGRELTPEARAAVRRRRLLAGAAAGALLLLVIVLLWPIGVLTGDGDGDEGSQAGGSASGDGQAASGRPAGVAVVAERAGKRQLVVQAANLPPNRQREAYEVWLYNSPRDARSVGAQVTDPRGTYQGAGPLPANFDNYRFIDVSREPIDRNAAHSGESVLRGRVPQLRRRNAQRGQAAILGQAVLTPPQGG
jgi:hypothetical protein